ncbi:hypothetical protein IOK49_03170 [Fervidicoccus fontis]|uniref:Uncharacterized protein n=2 Tax=Fervidicoccus fontis TaxID=683846 RepID=I0A0F8_FERFK|nr:hypothetical protein [Fervidicoccus fontis]AFH42465.1 hypothetical protein FFONT_0475 [Fervidicoccus fontis Kam940]MBE9391079.1 hypothetical protein [Fervidicoccus fontis]PMB77023.1 MAG: hypothetical protein C0177_04485 [Fervidicoccus fontis]HEW63673.1 hypothetical protein [Fervidicoccus fontis]
MSERGKKRFLAISEDIITEAMNISEKVGIPFTTLIERALSDVFKVMKYKPQLIDALSYADAVDDIRKLGGIVIPMTFFKKNIEKLSDKELEDLANELYKMSLWYGELAKVKRGISVDELKRAISLWIPSSNIEVIENGSEMKIIVSLLDANDKVLSVSKRIIEGLLEGFDLKVKEISLGNSLIIAKVHGKIEEK